MFKRRNILGQWIYKKEQKKYRDVNGLLFKYVDGNRSYFHTEQEAKDILTQKGMSKQMIAEFIYFKNYEFLCGLICPKCQKRLVIRKGPKGCFYGCTGFPACKHTSKI